VATSQAISIAAVLYAIRQRIEEFSDNMTTVCGQSQVRELLFTSTIYHLLSQTMSIILPQKTLRGCACCEWATQFVHSVRVSFSEAALIYNALIGHFGMQLPRPLATTMRTCEATRQFVPLALRRRQRDAADHEKRVICIAIDLRRIK